jgi:hypothetical protein
LPLVHIRSIAGKSGRTHADRLELAAYWAAHGELPDKVGNVQRQTGAVVGELLVGFFFDMVSPTRRPTRAALPYQATKNHEAQLQAAARRDTLGMQLSLKQIQFV